MTKGVQPVHPAPTEATAVERFSEFVRTWGEKYPATIVLWNHTRSEFVPFLDWCVAGCGADGWSDRP